MLRYSSVGSSALLAFTVGCGGAQSGDWRELDREERLAYMSDVVEPTMREMFQENDPERWADFSCHSCHGDDFVERDYAMPADLFALPLDGTLDSAMAHDPETTAFMLEEVFPVFVDLIGETKYASGSNPDGYRCVGCHAVAPG